MAAQTKVSEKGQIVVPKPLRDRLGWTAGTDLDVIETGDGVFLRQRRSDKRLSPQQSVARFRDLYTHSGAPVSLEQMRADAAEQATRAR